MARELSYVPNPNARSLRTGRTGAIGVYFPGLQLVSAFYTQFLAGVALESESRGYAVALMPANAGPLQQRLLAQVDAVIVVDPLVGDPVVRQLFGSGLPIVCAERCLEPDLQPIATIETDYVHVERQPLDHMRRQGARAPALLSLAYHASILEKFEDGYTSWCHQNGVTPVVIKPEAAPDAHSLVAYFEEFLGAPGAPDAVLAGADGLALALTKAARNLGLEVGRDLLVSSAVDHEVYDLVSPSITAIVAPPVEIGRDAARVIQDVLDGVDVPRHIMRPPSPIAFRSSTGDCTTTDGPRT